MAEPLPASADPASWAVVAYPSSSSSPNHEEDDHLSTVVVAATDRSTADVLRCEKRDGEDDEACDDRRASLPDPSPLVGPPSASAGNGTARASSHDDSVELLDPEDYVLAMFIVRFDTHRGNTVAWTYPENIDLSGIEFSALPSGLHLVEDDVIYFCKNTYFGVSVFENTPLEGEEGQRERGARMAAVGLLSAKYAHLHRHVDFLQEAARFHAADEAVSRQLLTWYYENQRKRTHRSSATSMSSDPVPTIAVPRQPRLNTHHPAKMFVKFVGQCGPSIFVLWKHALLAKRILFMAAPPLAVASSYVYCTCLLASVASDCVDRDDPPQLLQPMFCVGVNDLHKLQLMDSYVAFTSEQILCEKRNTYDLLVEPRMVRKRGQVPRAVLDVSAGPSTTADPIAPNSLQRLNTADRRRFGDLARTFAGIPAQEGLWQMLERWWQQRLDAAMTGEPAGTVAAEEYDAQHEPLLASEAQEAAAAEMSSATPSLSSTAEGFEEIDANVELVGYFQSINTTLLRHIRFLLSEQESSADGYTTIAARHLEDMGLHPRDDAEFVEQLAALYYPRYGPVRVQQGKQRRAELKTHGEDANAYALVFD
ncbi:hypothetical protein SYNPS1DRAFT_28898 [Syncephalis pseudoplumigaleata]|uniref:UDENN domain-containing protein n=1 Tax=Syncephalis pseudoplumigaleata TaxID=1712513 RepID=A0A4V1J1K4_9FUNG|nr:hypothetical protein SYNPS1DRAFT_28898 [Syncephalis pseudoplumigaleata]|eukprot:RKP25369.1 hypothetical protein SYNPS1DRAFT_28898 [Syncephalis pseudoplumigaleata]